MKYCTFRYCATRVQRLLAKYNKIYRNMNRTNFTKSYST